MVEFHMTFYCAKGDCDVVVAALRGATKSPVHVRAEQVFGHDFGDARTAEQVRGSLGRAAIELVAAANEVDGLVAAVTDARRTLPVRWHTAPIAKRGRIE